MSIHTRSDESPPFALLDALIARHGVVPMILFLLAAHRRARRRARLPDAADLPDSLRRDIGLSPLAEAHRPGPLR